MTAPGQDMISSDTITLVERAERERLAFIASGAMEGKLYGDPAQKLHAGDTVYLVPGAKWNMRLVQSGMLRLKSNAPAPDLAELAKERYYESIVNPLAMKKMQLEQAIDNADAEIAATQERQDEARVQLVEVAQRLKDAIAKAPK